MSSFHPSIFKSASSIYAKYLNSYHSFLLTRLSSLTLFSCFRNSDSLPFTPSSLSTSSILGLFGDKYFAFYDSLADEEKLFYLSSSISSFSGLHQFLLLIFRVALKYLLKLIFNLIDFSVLVFVVFLFSCFHFLLFPAVKIIPDLYICLCWKDKLASSPKYYFRDFPSSSSSFCFYSDFFGYRSVSFALLSTLNHSRIISVLYLCSLSTFFKSIFHLLWSISSDLVLSIQYPNLFLYFLHCYSSINRRFLYIINSFCIQAYLLACQNANVTCWHENQTHSSSITALLRYNHRLFPLSHFQFYSFMGFPVSSYGGLSNYKVSSLDDRLLTCFPNIVVQDIFSLQDLADSSDLPPHFSISLSRESLQRYAPIHQQFLVQNISPTRTYTIYTHSLEFDFDLLLSRSLHQLFINSGSPPSLLIYLRLHPALSDGFVSDRIRFYNSLFPNLEFAIIDSSSETIYQSIAKSSCNIFSESGYLNFSLVLKRTTLVYRTSFRNNPPIHSNFLSSKFLSLL